MQEPRPLVSHARALVGYTRSFVLPRFSFVLLSTGAGNDWAWHCLADDSKAVATRPCSKIESINSGCLLPVLVKKRTDHRDLDDLTLAG